MWTFSLLFSFAAVTGPMYSGASAFLFIYENPAIIPLCNLKSKVKMSILFWVCLVEVLQNKMYTFTMLMFTKIPEDVLPYLD